MKKLATGIATIATAVVFLLPGVAGATPEDGLDSDPGVRENLVGSSSLLPPVNPLPANIKRRSNAESRLSAPINPLPYAEPDKEANADRVQREGDKINKQDKQNKSKKKATPSRSGR